jgi:acetyltransferase-like isoleucine patch superfamily enzyme
MKQAVDGTDERQTYYVSETAKIGSNCDIRHGVIIEDDVVIGDNCFIGEYTFLRRGVHIGNNVDIRQFCYFAEEAKVGSYIKIFQYSNIAKWTVIEDFVYIGARVLMVNTRRIAFMREYKLDIKGPHIKRGARIASGAVILPAVTIGENALVGMAALITKDVPDRQIWFGVPAIKRGNVPEAECISENLAKSKNRK